METTAQAPGHPGSTQGGTAAGEHIHRLLALAKSLARSAGAARRADQPADGWCETETLISTALGLDLAALDDHDAAAWAQTLEHLNRFLQGLLVLSAGDISERVSAGRYQESGSRKPVDHLSSTLKISRSEAGKRLRLAERFLPSTDPLTHVTAPASQPVLGSALFSGLVSAEQALMVSGFVDQAARLESSGTVQAGTARSLEATLADHAEVEPPYFLRHLGIRALALLDPDGQKPSEAQRLAKQGLFFRRPYRGWVRIDGYLTISQYEQTMACIDWATNPQRQNNRAKDAAHNPPEIVPPVQVWRRPLAPEEIPPRPPGAPPDAIPRPMKENGGSGSRTSRRTSMRSHAIRHLGPTWSTASRCRNPVRKSISRI